MNKLTKNKTIKESKFKLYRLRFKYRLLITIFLFALIFMYQNTCIFLIIFFAIDYVLYRIDKTNEYKNHLPMAQKMLEERNFLTDLYKEIIEDAYKENISIDDLQNNPISTLVEHRLRIPIINNFIQFFNIRNKKILDIGCSTGHFTKLYQINNNITFGLDINFALVQKSKKQNVITSLGNVASLPFSDNTFDVVNFCEVLEHLYKPYVALQEINRVLKKGGLLLITTNNRSALSILDIINPLIICEKIIGLFTNKILPHPNLLMFSPRGYYFHTEFSNKDISEMLTNQGFKILHFKSSHIPFGSVRLLNILPFFVSPIKLAGYVYKIQKMFLIPILGKLGEHWEIYAQKR